MRSAVVVRETAETRIRLCLNLDGSGKAELKTGVGFLNHMLELFARHSGFDLELGCDGDTDVDDHHSVEDIAICLGRAVKETLSDCRGIRRYGDILLPMDETLILCALDVSGRGGFYQDLHIPTEKVGTFDTELVVEFFTAFARESGITLHLRQLAGSNSHHILEGCFKATARALKNAVSIDPENAGSIPSSKGVLG